VKLSRGPNRPLRFDTGNLFQTNGAAGIAKGVDERVGDLSRSEKTRILTEGDPKTLNSDEFHDLLGSGTYPQNAHVVVRHWAASRARPPMGLPSAPAVTAGENLSRAASAIEAAQAWLALYAEGVQYEGDDVVLADEHRHLDELALVEVCGEYRPGVIGDAGVGVELVDGAKHCGLQLGPSLHLGADLDPSDLPV
jgi:hypothetical protein